MDEMGHPGKGKGGGVWFVVEVRGGVCVLCLWPGFWSRLLLPNLGVSEVRVIGL